MSERLERLGNRQHAVVAMLALWLVATSPWIAMLRRLPAGAGWLDYAHVGLGCAALLLCLTYGWTCTREGKWRLYFPVTAARLGSVTSDLAGLLRGRLPAAESGGLFGLIEGLLLLALAITGLTGAAWLATQGSNEALAWRECHVYAARGFIVLLVLHVATVSLHLLDFVRD
jgi:Prokaryotic cytochrome b561